MADMTLPIAESVAAMDTSGRPGAVIATALSRLSRRVVLGGALGPLVLSVLSLAAWSTGATGLASFGADYIPMAPSTAIGFALIGAALLAVTFGERPAIRRAAVVAALVVAGLATVTLVEFLTGATTLNFERALVAQPGTFGAVPLARMSPLTAIGFLLTGLAVTLPALRPEPIARDAGGLLGGFVSLAGGTVVLGYIYGAPLLYGGRVIPMALTTGLAFIGTGAALVAHAGSTALPLRPGAGSSARARLLRLFLPLTVAAVVVNGIAMHAILARSSANPALLAAIFAIASAAAVGVAVTGVARALGGAIDRAERALRRSQEELEQRVRERTAELSDLNRELEAFSYSVSHDLRAPLRHVIGYARMLEEDAGSALDAQSAQHVVKVIESATRMSGLIEGLLELSRTTRAGLRKRPVNLAALVRQAQAEVTTPTCGSSVVWRVQDPLPEVVVDPGLFHQVLANLLSNAVKYSSRAAAPEVEVGAQTSAGGETTLFVRDNGVGFDMRYADRLFGVFQRLHSAADFEGTGIGLANVRRIVQRHGGRTWAESAVGRGATFYVALPAAAAADGAATHEGPNGDPAVMGSAIARSHGRIASTAR